MSMGLVAVRFTRDWRHWQSGKIYELGIGVANALCNNAHVAEYVTPTVQELDGGLSRKPIPSVHAEPLKSKLKRLKRSDNAVNESD